MKRLLAKSASAGSGKTTALVFRYVSLLLGGAKADEIIALTFTVKAANNMKERIFAALDDMQNYKFLDALCDECEITKDEAIKKAASISANLSSSAMRISTLDSFFASILSKFCFYAGVPYGYETVENIDIAKLKAAFIGALDEERTDSVASFLAEHDKGLSYFLELFDFLESKNGDANELFYHAGQETIGFAQVAATLVENIAKHAQNDRQKKLFVFDTIETLAGKTWLANKHLCDHSFLAKLEFDMDALASFEELKVLIKEYFVHKEAKLASTIKALFVIYEIVKNANFTKKGKVSFSDISLIVFDLLRGNNALDTQFLYFRLDGKINHILIDEFQDTSLLQYEILWPLIEEVASGHGQSELGTFFFVGDVKQSIYRFRGGNSELFGVVADTLAPYGLVVEHLDTNYRSDKAIVEFANEMFEGVMSGYQPQLYRKDARAGYVEVIETSTAEETDEENSHNPLCIETVRIINSLIELGVRASDIAVLTATNADSVAVVDAIGELTGLEALQDVSLKVVDSKPAIAVISYIKYLFFNEPIYKELFLSSLDAPLFGQIPKMSLDKPPCEIVADVMSRFEIFDEEAYKLVEIACGFDDIYDFVHEVDDNKTKLPEGKSDGIKVLTVHKSKGLEFGYTICMDRTASRGANDDSLLFEYNGLKLAKAFVRFANREVFDVPYASAKEQEKKAQEVDRLNMLYVAFTRAEHALFVVKKAPKLLKSGEVKYDGVFTLDALDVGTRGALEVVQKHEAQRAKGNISDFEPKDYGRQEVVKQKEMLDTPLESIYQGLALHTLMENIDFSNMDESFCQALQAVKNRYGSLVQDMANVERMGKNAGLYEPFVKLLEGADIYKECAFCTSSKVGRLDLLAIKDGQAVIVDYKSSSSAKKEHLIQLRRYKEAITSITGKPPSVFVYALGDKPSLEEL